MKLIFFDTEFDNFADLGMISAGFVTDCAEHSFYVENKNYKRDRCSDFVIDTVLPLLKPERYAMEFSEMKQNFEKWVNSIEDDELIFLSDYGGDVKIFWKHFNGINTKKRIKTEMIWERLEKISQGVGIASVKEISQHTTNLQFIMEEQLEKQPKNRHHALYDAECHRIAWHKILPNILKG